MSKWLAVVLALGLVSPAWSQESKSQAPDMNAMMKAFAEAAQPSPELQKIKPLAGNFTYAGKFWMDPSAPPLESKGKIERKWILGNRFLEEKVTGKGLDGKSDFEGRGVLGYDKNEKKFTSGWISDMSTAIVTSTGTADASGKTLTFEREEYCPIRKMKVKGRDEVKIESDDKHVMTMYEIDGGKETKMMELTATREK